MVSAAKLKGDENRLERAKPFNAWTSTLNPERTEIDLTTPYDDFPQKTLLVPFTSEKGLCGGVNSFISRSVRDAGRKLTAQGKDFDVAVIGDKGRGQLRRFVPDKIILSATDVVAPGTYSLASSISSQLIEAGAADYDAVVLFYNTYVNAAVYKQMYQIVYPFGEKSEEALSAFEFDGDQGEMMQDLYEFMLSTQIYYAFMDGATSEQSSRMTAMENASKNANEMIDSLTLRYNRARQARITTELIEIISGASAIDN